MGDARIDAARACARNRDNWISDDDADAILAAADAVVAPVGVVVVDRSASECEKLKAALAGLLAMLDDDGWLETEKGDGGIPEPGPVRAARALVGSVPPTPREIEKRRELEQRLNADPAFVQELARGSVPQTESTKET